jgi:hypothetical protein
MILLVIEYFASFCNTSVIIVITSTNIGLRYDRWRIVVHILLVSCISFVVTMTKTKIKSVIVCRRRLTLCGRKESARRRLQVIDIQSSSQKLELGNSPESGVVSRRGSEYQVQYVIVTTVKFL